MAAGTMVVIAGPAVAAAGVGYGAYQATRAVRDHASSADEATMRGVLSRGTDSARRAGGLVASRAKVIVACASRNRPRQVHAAVRMRQSALDESREFGNAALRI